MAHDELIARLAWDATSPEQTQIAHVARSLMVADDKNPDDVLMFFDPFNWSGALTTKAGIHGRDEIDKIMNRRPAWTAPRWIRLACAALRAASDQVRG